MFTFLHLFSVCFKISTRLPLGSLNIIHTFILVEKSSIENLGLREKYLEKQNDKHAVFWEVTDNRKLFTNLDYDKEH